MKKMASSDSMFLVEINVEELRSHVKCRDFIIKIQFADIFTITLKDPDIKKENTFTKTLKPNRKNVKKRKKCNKSRDNKLHPGQSVSFASRIDHLISIMKKYPIELSLWSKSDPKYKLASTTIPWDTKYINFLHNLQISDKPQTITDGCEHKVFDDFTSRRMGAVKLNIMLMYLAKRKPTELRSLTVDTSDIMHIGISPSNENIESKPFDWTEHTGIIKTTFKGGKKYKKSSHKKNNKQKDTRLDTEANENVTEGKKRQEPETDSSNENKINRSIVKLVKSQTDIDNNKQIRIVRSKSCSVIRQDQLNILNYIFGDSKGPYGNKVYCVGYFTVENDNPSPKDSKSDKESPKVSPKVSSKASPKSSTNESPKASTIGSSKDLRNQSPKQAVSRERITLKYCRPDCKADMKRTSSVDLSTFSLDLPKEIQDDIEISKCHNIDCDHKKFKADPSKADDRILMDLTNLKKECCKEDTTTKVEEVVGGMKAKLRIGKDDPCYCECECTFGFVKKTTYCQICKGYEILGEEHENKLPVDMPFPCPVFHKLIDKIKSKQSTTGSDAKRTVKTKTKSIDSEKETKKGKKKKKDDKFKFNYGYTAPTIGHSRCAFPCTGTLGQVPKRMGWLWTADNIPGLKFRPAWKPGAANKHVVRLLKIARNPGQVFAKKKKRRNDGKPKRPLKRPLLTVHKKDGEYTVELETMKTYAKQRAINQVPFEDKDPITYTVGRTEEENYQRRKKKERMRRRLERDQREFIQSAFKDMCQEICLKTYQQALGILPDAEKPDCPCYPADPGPDKTDLDRSCSCSEDSQLSFSDTDEDEWVVEITPPIATYDPTYKSKKVALVDNETQYSYLDYRVKLLDRFGNPVPRFFIGPDGKQECSDLGGFWDPSHKEWLEINVDGYIGPDKKWAPNTFIGPGGDTVDAEIGKFQGPDGSWLVVGIDGYVDANGKWRFYSKSMRDDKKGKDKKKTVSKGAPKPVAKAPPRKQSTPPKTPSQKKKSKSKGKLTSKKSEATWSCFGDASAKYLSERGIMGHGHDRKLLLDTLKKLIAQGHKVKIPKPINVPYSKRRPVKKRLHFHDETKCRHATPSSKGVIAVDEDGNKIYFRIKDSKNVRPDQRIATLTDQGISLSSFHVPCFHSFINKEMLRRRLQNTESAPAPARHYRSAVA